MGGSTYFITYRCVPGSTLWDDARDIVLANWKHWHGRRYLLHAALVMPDHVHVIITPKQKGDGTWFSLQEIVHTNKGWTAHEINRHRRAACATGCGADCGGVWQDERFDRIIRDGAEFWQKWSYIAHNLVKAGLAASPGEYPWFYCNAAAWDAR